MIKKSLPKIVISILAVVFVTLQVLSFNNLYSSILQNKYPELWAKVEQFEKDGLPKSALEVVNEILVLAKSENNTPQIFKAYTHKLKFELQTIDNGQQHVLNTLRAEIEISTFPLKSMYQSLYAELLWNYYAENMWTISSRTYTGDFVPEDIETWDARRLTDEIAKYYLLSVENSTELQKIDINDYADILIDQNTSRNLRPTLFDLLAHRALDFFLQQNAYITEPVGSFSINNAAFFSSAPSFISLNRTSLDNSSKKYQVFRLFQKLMAFHIQDKTPEAFVDVDIMRLKYMRSQAVGLNNDSLYLSALIELQNQFDNHEVLAVINFEIASFYQSLAAKYNHFTSPEFKWEYKRAYDLCKSTSERFPEAPGTSNLKSKMNDIEQRAFTLRTESDIIPNSNPLMYITYRNINLLHFKVINISSMDLEKITYRMDDTTRLNYYNGLRPMKTFEVDFENEGDFQQHSTEIALDPLPSGRYLIMASPDKSFTWKENKVDYLTLNVTNLSFTYQRNEDYSYSFYVLNRNSGAPIPKVKADCFYEEYNYTKGEYETKKLGIWYSDLNGEFKVPAASRYRNFMVEFTYGSDKLTTDQYFYQYENYREKKRMQTRTQFFTDRSIYRPGQTLYFKGIVVDTDGETSTIKPNFNTTVVLYDVNWQKVGEMPVTTNEFGSFNGTFVLPEGLLTGQMNISDSWGRQYFSVEEYKRPKFEVKFKDTEGFYKLNQKVEVVGSAMAYAGYAIDGAKVSYVITRSMYYPFHRYWMWYPPVVAQSVIGQGEMLTDAEGKFTIGFLAEPDPSVNKKYQPAFIYTINADVTDINGETRSSSVMVYVGYKSMVLSTTISDFFSPDEKPEFKISATNLSGTPVSAKGSLVISSITPPHAYFVSRPWERPDRPKMTEAEFKKTYPLYTYGTEDQPTEWKDRKEVYKTEFNTDSGKVITIPEMVNWNSGWYHIIMTSVDPFGEEIVFEHYFKFYSAKHKKINFQSPFWVVAEKAKGEPGEKAVFIVGSAASEAQILVCVEHKQKIVSKQWHKIEGNHKIIEIPILEAYRGNFTVHMAMVKDSRVYTFYRMVSVPYSNKELSIRFETFRDKLLPGEEEEWRIVISGPNGEKAAAEMAAVLYDASLDAFRSHYWSMYLNYYDYASSYFAYDNTFGSKSSSNIGYYWNSYYGYSFPIYDILNTYGLPNFYGWTSYYSRYDISGGAYYPSEGMEIDGEVYFAVDEVSAQTVSTGRSGNTRTKDDRDNSVAEDAPSAAKKNGSGEQQDLGLLSGDKLLEESENTGGESPNLDNVTARANFNETAFFYPNLKTNENGEVVISFKVPESLTKWRMMGFAHTKDLKTGYISNNLVTQKDLMVMPNMPRFFREGDKFVLVSKISNLSEEKLNGKARLTLFDAMTMQPIDLLMNNTNPEISFSAEPGQSVSVSWNISVPAGIQAVTCRIVAATDQFSDGEEHTLPVLTNSMLVTESLPLPIRSNQTKTFRHEKLINSGKSSTLRHHQLVLEFTANPAWYAVQALPYIMEYPYECAEQVFTRYYANMLATHVANSNPKLKAVFDSWLTAPDSEALLSNLEKNQELKNVLLEETPWVMDAKNEAERKKRIALLFDLSKMAKETDRALRKLKKMQKPGGGWVWFDGFPADRYITQHIVCGFGHLDKLNVMKVKDKKDVWEMVAAGIGFIDNEIRKDYEYLKKYYNAEQLAKNHLSNIAIHYLYTRSFYMTYVDIPTNSREAVEYYVGQAQKYWLETNLYEQGMISLALHRMNDLVTPKKILKSLDERAIRNEELGMFWQENTAGYYWWQAPIETQAIMIEAFNEISGDVVIVDELKTWLLKMKQVQDWKTTKATADAIYVLLLTGQDWLATESAIEITVGDQLIDPNNLPGVKAEAGTGYFKTSWPGEQVKPNMGEVKVVKKDEGVSWGALYWQYFEDLDKITPHETPLKINKKLFIERTTPKGKELEEIIEGGKLKVGDKVIVRIEIRVDRDMEYVHMKDMRAAGFEPINVISQYKWQGGIGYYESTRDAATNFFMDRLPKGTYVFEYPLRATMAGNFSNGITTIQCMYAPEFASHSEGIRVNILP